MGVDGARDKLTLVVARWPGVAAGPHRFGGTEFRLAGREIGHIHGDSLVDIPFPKKLRDDLVATGQARPHHWLPDSGWISLPIRDGKDLRWALILLRHSFELATEQRGRRRQAARSGPTRPAAPRAGSGDATPAQVA